MIKRLNFTGRKRLKKSDIEILQAVDDTGGAAFSAKFQFPDSFPADGHVVVEAWSGVTLQRFDFGTVGNIASPSDLRLTEVDLSRRVKYRVRVVQDQVGAGELFASIDNIRPLTDLDDQDSLIWIETNPAMDEVPWKLDFSTDEGYPIIMVNRNIPGLTERIRSDQEMQALILPGVLREVLSQCTRMEKEGGLSDQAQEIMDFANGLFHRPDVDDLEDDVAWIDDVVRIFCDQRKFAAVLSTADQESVG
jgi:hypothetical protein